MLSFSDYGNYNIPMNATFHGVFGPCWTASSYRELYGKELNDISMEKNNSK